MSAIARPAAPRPVLYAPGRGLQIVALCGAAFVLFLAVLMGLSVYLSFLAGAALIGIVAWRWPMAGVMALVLIGPIHAFLMMLLYHYTGSAAIVKGAQLWKELVVLVLVARTLDFAFRARRAPRIHALDLVIGAYLTYLIVYLFYPATIPGVTLATKLFGLRADGFFLLAYFAGRGLRLRERELRWMLAGLLVVSALIAAVALFQWVSPTRANNIMESLGFSEYLQLQRQDRAVSYAVRGNYINGQFIPRASSLLLSDLGLAFYSLLVVPLAAGVLFSIQRARERILANVMLMALLGTTALTVTRSAIVAVVPMIAAMVVWSRSFVAAAIIGLQLIVVGLLALTYLGYSSGVLGRMFSPNEPSAHGHVEAIRRSMGIIQEEPLGRGLGTAGQVAQRFVTVNGVTNESWYLQIATEAGVIAAGLFALILLVTAVTAFANFLRAREPATAATALGIAGATIGFAVVGITLHAWEALTVSIVFWLFAGAVVSAEPSRRTAKEH